MLSRKELMHLWNSGNKDSLKIMIELLADIRDILNGKEVEDSIKEEPKVEIKTTKRGAKK